MIHRERMLAQHTQGTGLDPPSMAKTRKHLPQRINMGELCSICCRFQNVTVFGNATDIISEDEALCTVVRARFFSPQVGQLKCF